MSNKVARKNAIEATKPAEKVKPTNPYGNDGPLTEDLAHLKDLKDAEKKAKAAFDEFHEERMLMERYVIDRMDFEGIDSMKSGGTNFVPTRTIMGRITDSDAFIAWAETQDEDLLRPPEPRSGEVNSLVRRYIDDGEALPPGVDYFVREYVSTKAA